MKVFSTSISSVGSANPIILPANMEGGERRLLLFPPQGHAWTYVDNKGISVSLPMDYPLTFDRNYLQPPFSPNDQIGKANLDSGSGNLQGVLS